MCEWRKNRHDPTFQMRKAIKRLNRAHRLRVHAAVQGPLHNALYCLEIALEKQMELLAGKIPKPLETRPVTKL